MAELVDASDSKSDSARSAGSIPARGTILLSEHVPARLNFLKNQSVSLTVCPPRSYGVRLHPLFLLVHLLVYALIQHDKYTNNGGGDASHGRSGTRLRRTTW